jgi:hypothetical protein
MLKMIKDGTKWNVVDDGGKVVGVHNTSGGAQKQINELTTEASKPIGTPVETPKPQRGPGPTKKNW